jgi:starch-binding outer membrane protein, SusD/RagB family
MTKSIKKIYISLAITGCIAVLGSCNKKLDVDPRQSVELGTTFKNEEEIEQGIIGCYSLMGAAALYGTDLNIVPELLGAEETAQWVGTFSQYYDVQDKQMSTSNDAAIRIWVGAYRVINLANVIRDILTGPNAATVIPDADRRNELIGEAEFIRGLMHFEVVRLFGNQYDASTLNTPGAVIKLKGAIDTTAASEKPLRNTIAQTYTQVIADLTSASQKLPESNDVRANKFTALAFLSRVYLQKGDYANALNAANTVIEDGGYGVPSIDVMTPFRSKNSAEVIFEIQQNDQNNAGSANDGMATFYADLANGVGRGDFAVSPDFADLYDSADKRFIAWYYIGAVKGNISCAKWYSYGQNLPIIRIAEMYLTRAECNIRLGSSTGDTPANDLARINNPSRTAMAVIGSPTLDDVILQRRLELAFEGLNIHDLRRLRKPIGSFTWNSDEIVMPIPQREIDATQGSIVQNEAYK